MTVAFVPVSPKLKICSKDFVLSHSVFLAATTDSMTSSSASSSSLRAVVALSNHGTIAPSQDALKLCPQNAANLNAYTVPYEHLTEVGMKQMLLAGGHTRNVYVDGKKFIAPTLKQKPQFDTYFRADPSRGQSSVTFGYGLYPDTTVMGFPVPVPVVMQLVSNEHDIAVTNGPCQATLNKDLANFAATRGKKLLKKHAAVVKQLEAACGGTLGSANANQDFRTLAHMLSSDRIHGRPPLVNAALFDQIQSLAFDQMLDEYLGTPRQVTYYVGGFPDLMRSQLNASATSSAADPIDSYKLYAYTGRRELVHGMGQMLRLEFDFPNQPRSTSFNTTAIPSGATMFFELHMTPEPVVETHIWSPETARRQVKLHKCSAMACPLGEFNAIIENHVNATSSWQDLCEYHPVNKIQDPSTADGLTMPVVSQYSLILGVVLVALTLFAMQSACSRINQFKRQSQYTRL
ncbi:unnamed protein product [Aphanomyces euteiches]